MTTPTRRKFFEVRTEISGRAGAYEFENEDEVFGGYRLPRHVHTISAKIPGKEYNMYTGLPNLREKPRLRIGTNGKKPIDYYGPRRAFVSSKAKNLLYSIDAEALESVECDTFDRDGNPVEPYWMFGVKRFVPEFNYNLSEFITQSDVSEKERERAVIHSS